MFIQSDENWKDYEMAPGITLGVYGCFITAVCNILVKLGMDYTPLSLTQKLKDNNGLDSQGYLNRTVLDNLFGLKENIYKPTDTINWSDSNNVWYIVQNHYLDTGHFCNVLSVKDGTIFYFDTYDGLNKQVQIERV